MQVSGSWMCSANLTQLHTHTHTHLYISVETRLRNVPLAFRWVGEWTKKVAWEKWASCVLWLWECVTSMRLLNCGMSVYVCTLPTVHKRGNYTERLVATHTGPPDFLQVIVTSMWKCVQMFETRKWLQEEASSSWTHSKLNNLQKDLQQPRPSNTNSSLIGWHL